MQLTCNNRGHNLSLQSNRQGHIVQQGTTIKKQDPINSKIGALKTRYLGPKKKKANQ